MSEIFATTDTSISRFFKNKSFFKEKEHEQ
jgi:hypothetical protein